VVVTVCDVGAVLAVLGTTGVVKATVIKDAVVVLGDNVDVAAGAVEVGAGVVDGPDVVVNGTVVVTVVVGDKVVVVSV
jgi:hypothetical protein